MEDLPVYISIVFGLTTFLAIFLFYRAAGNSTLFAIVILIWLGMQSILALSGFYAVASRTPPRFIFLLLPPLLLIAGIFYTARGRRMIDKLDPGILTLLHVSRIPVELVLFWLFLYRVLPQAMTFKGGNLDILSGLSAPFIYFFGFVRPRMGKMGLLAWNLLCLGLLAYVVATAILSFPSPFQRFGLDQPAIALLHFPFVWLPSCVVPLVLFSHLATIRRVMKT